MHQNSINIIDIKIVPFSRKLLFCLAVLLGMHSNAISQFYNGHQMEFGKNRIQYRDFIWSYIEYSDYDIYFGEEDEKLAMYTGQIAHNHLIELEQTLNHKMDKRLTFIVYNRLTEFRQSNIGLVTGKQEYNIGGVTNITHNKISLYYQGDYKEYVIQLRKSIVETILREILYGKKLSENFASSSILEMPDWYYRGLISYFANRWDNTIDIKLQNALIDEKYTRFYKLKGDEAIHAGHCFWNYVALNYGENAVRDIIVYTKINKNPNHAFMNVLGLEIKDLTKEWIDYYKMIYGLESQIDNHKPDKQIHKKIKNKICYQLNLNPDGNKIAYVTNQNGLFKVWIYNIITKKHKLIYKDGEKLEQIPDYTFPVLEWHPRENALAFIYEKEGKLKLTFYELEEEKYSTRNILYLDKILDFKFSQNAQKLVMSAVKDGKADIYIHELAAFKSIQITNDYADDHNPDFYNKDKEIIFSSNRNTDSLKLDHYVDPFKSNYDLYTYTLDGEKSIKRLSETPLINETKPLNNKSKIFYLSNQYGANNIFESSLDSSILHIDTIIHYQYFLAHNQVTNSRYNINEFDISNNGKVLRLTNKSGIFNIENIGNSDVNQSQKSVSPIFDKIQESQQSKSIGDKKETSKNKFDSNIYYYKFEHEKENYNKIYEDILIDTLPKSQPKTKDKKRIYRKTFYYNQFVGQADFNFLNTSYQPYTGGAIYYNPGLSTLFKVGIADLFEDYKLTVGFRFSVDFKSNEYLISFEDLKKKVDKQYIFHKQTMENTTPDFISKSQSNSIHTIFNYPFSQVSAFKTTLSGRYDKLIYLSTDKDYLAKDNVNDIRAGVKLEYIFDNTISHGTNLFEGTRFKIFGEAFHKLDEWNSDIFILGFDLRNYVKVHKDIILATRLAASTSFGHQKLVYYLGGVDNWTNFSATTPTFIPVDEVLVDTSQHYAYQTVATNLRGFPQNIRNGNSFAVANIELRWPFVKYFANYPITSSFWSNLMAIGFFDIGSAWNGVHPFTGDNEYQKQYIHNGPILITIDTERDPIVAGYGIGLRAKVLGYFLRFDYAWGIENMLIQDPVFYFSLSLDF